ncbi:hibernation-specific plasma protein HP-55-like [Conger conger]|uniref:hibernation-specific plasma protein HP-55-like n=1 Tax=Conger conger TaxID=82655 RepID=UPI002A59E033|nr:hibernation-specific plasma protein HP-55-like [Conger conger]
MRVLLSLCASLVLLWSTVQCRPSHDHSHHGNNNVSISANGSLKIYQENLDFAFRLYKHISAQTDYQSKNVFFSPLSVSVALAALSVGARGKTHQQLFEGLGFNSTEITTEEVNQAFQHIHHNLNEKTDVDLSLGNALFIGQEFKPRPEFLESMKRYYESEGFSTDFSKPEEAKEQINKYVNEKTKGKISELVQDVDPLTVMYIINYIYFKGKWQIPFDPKATKEHDFHVDDKTTVSVPMMYEEDYFHVYQDEDISILQLHKWIRSVAMMNYQVYVPKLSLKTSYELKEILPEMGITDIFGDTADLTGISEERKLAVSKVMHKATIDMDEAGATAAAATGIGGGGSSAGFPAPTPVLKFDRPFMVFVLNGDTRSIMFMGKIVNPAK